MLQGYDGTPKSYIACQGKFFVSKETIQRKPNFISISAWNVTETS